jgi:hypothetical protein
VDGLRFPNRSIIVPGALNPIEIDYGRTGSFIEPNEWMQHPVAEREHMD